MAAYLAVMMGEREGTSVELMAVKMVETMVVKSAVELVAVTVYWTVE